MDSSWRGTIKKLFGYKSLGVAVVSVCYKLLCYSIDSNDSWCQLGKFYYEELEAAKKKADEDLEKIQVNSGGDKNTVKYLRRQYMSSLKAYREANETFQEHMNRYNELFFVMPTVNSMRHVTLDINDVDVPTM